MILPFAAIDWTLLTGAFALADIAVVFLTWFWILTYKREPVSALAWCLLVLLVPFFGSLCFFFFGYQNINRPLKWKRKHAVEFRTRPDFSAREESPGTDLTKLAGELGAGPMLDGNGLAFYAEGADAFEAMLETIASAKHHIHMEFFIARGDESGRRFMAALAAKAKDGVEVRFLYDAVGSWSLNQRVLKVLTDAGGKAVPFMSLLSPLRRRFRINLRNHRKIMVVDGCIGFTGGLNLADEYLGKVAKFGPWRDLFLRLEGPSVRWLQRVFAEDWDFSTDEDIIGDAYFPKLPPSGSHRVQIAWSGPDMDAKTIREIYFAAIMSAKKRVWLATPYFVPDSGLLDALCVAAKMGRDVRLLCPFRPDKWLPHFAGRYLWGDVLNAGARIYQYTQGFLHSKSILIDDDWASVGTVNFDNRSFWLNFEVTCLIESPTAIAELAAIFEEDFSRSIRLDADVFRHRPFICKAAENASRLLAPVL